MANITHLVVLAATVRALHLAGLHPEIYPQGRNKQEGISADGEKTTRDASVGLQSGK